MQNFCRATDKGELHVHLNGLVSTKAVTKALLEEAVLPESFNIQRDLIVSKPAGSLAAYLKPWEFLRLIPNRKATLDFMVQDAFAQLASQNVTFVELRSSVTYIAGLNQISCAEAMRWLLDSISIASNKFKIEAGLIMTISRGPQSLQQLESLLTAYMQIDEPKEVIGLDLAGDEGTHYPQEIERRFVSAKHELGLGITIHAGETGIAQNVEIAVRNFEADRIGHGTAASKSPHVMELLAKNDICVEVCPISNERTNSVPVDTIHPVVDFVEHGVPFVICADNPAIHSAGISDDYIAVWNSLKIPSILEEMYALQQRYSFLRPII